MENKKSEVDKIIIETCPVVGKSIHIETVSDENKETIKTENKLTTYFHDPEYTKITLVVDGTNVALYEGKEFKNSVP